MNLKKQLLNFGVLGLAITMLAGCQAGPKKVKGDIPLTVIPSGQFVSPPEEYKHIFKNIYFDYDKSDIRADMEGNLVQIAEWLKTNAQVLLKVEGHCDERGSDEYNLALGERRSLSVRRFLVEQGVDSARITTVSFGEERPANPGHDEAAWAENRRCEFKLAQ